MKLSLRKRLLRNTAVPLVLGVAAIGYGAYINAKAEAEAIYDAQLSHFAHILYELSQDEVQEGHLAKRVVRILKDTHVTVYEKDFSYRVWVDNALLLESENAQSFGLELERAGYADRVVGGQHLRLFVLKVGNVTVEVSEDYHVRNDLLHQVASSILLPFFFILPLLVLVICWGLRIGLKPLDRLSAYVASINPDDLERVEVDISVPRELFPFVLSINQLMQRVEEVIEREKRFTGYAAHELRTPLAALKTQLQVALREKNVKQRNDMFTESLTCIDRMTHLVSQLLLLLRSQKGEQVFVPVNLSALMTEIAGQFDKTLIENQQQLVLAIQPEVIIAGNADMLRVMVRNLVDNACRYSPHGAEIRLELKQDAQGLFIAVFNSGITVDAEQALHMFEPFYRGKLHASTGAGLGLAIVSWIARMHQLHVTCVSENDGVSVQIYNL